MNDLKIPKYTEQEIPEVENLLKAVFLVAFLVSSFFVAQAGVKAIDFYFLDINSLFHFVLKLGFVIGLALLNSVLLMGLAILGHEAAHRVLFKSVFWNDLCGGILAALILLPFYNFRDFHFTHHTHTHKPGLDPEEPVNNHPAWFTLIAGAFIGLYIHYKTFAIDFLRGSKKQRINSCKDVCFLSIVGVLYFYLVPILGISIWNTTVPTLLSIPLVFMFRNVSEHHGIPAQYKKNTNQVENPPNFDSWMVLTNPIMAWLWSNINYHQVHHRYPYLSHRYLPEIFEATKDDQPYLVVKGYLRALMNSINQAYYGSNEDVQQFLTTKLPAKS